MRDIVALGMCILNFSNLIASKLREHHLPVELGAACTAQPLNVSEEAGAKPRP